MTTFVTASVCVVRDGALLTVRKRGTSKFMLPGGKLEPGESPVQCAVREAAEEIGLVLAPSDLVELGDWTAEAANEPGALVQSTVFVAPAGQRRSGPSARSRSCAGSRLTNGPTTWRRCSSSTCSPPWWHN